MTMTGKITAELHNWERDPRNIFWGDIHGDTKERWKNGTRIHTSLVLEKLDCGDFFLIQTLNSIYKLPKDKELKHDQRA
jgi:hypothetical protein